MLDLREVDMLLAESFYFLSKLIYGKGSRERRVRVLRRGEDLQKTCGEFGGGDWVVSPTPPQKL